MSLAIDDAARPRLTPAGLQDQGVLTVRRRIVAGANVVLYAALLTAAALVLRAGGWNWVDGLILACLVLALPWTVLGFCNATLGLWLLHGTADGMARVAPFASAGDLETPIRVRTAVLLTLRNEDSLRAFTRLRVVRDSLLATGQGERFAFFVLSDSSRPEVIAAERALHAAMGAHDVIYRHRPVNTGFKAGSLRAFCAEHGHAFDLMLPLDADSLMDGRSIVRLVRMMQAHPRIGILQSLIVGLPSRSAFARIFQFGMRQGMRSYTMGSAWWIGDCGPFWGHNGLVRIQPFAQHCDLPVLPGGPPLGGHVMSHDQIEAALMRKAGYEVRVLPEELGSWEENPPTILDFVRRDLRWCQGNMQYLRLLATPGLLPASRFQLVWAVLMFIGIPAWTLLIALLPVAAMQDQGGGAFPTGLAIGAWLAFLLMYLSPKLAGMADVLLTPGGTRRYGGTPRFLSGAVTEIAFSFLQGAVSTFSTSIFMIGLLFGRSVIWNGQSRDAHALPWRTALARLWPQQLFGVVVCGLLYLHAPSVLWWGAPLLLGFLVAVPFAVLTAAPALGAFLGRIGLCAIPEEQDTPPEIRALL